MTWYQTVKFKNQHGIPPIYEHNTLVTLRCSPEFKFAGHLEQHMVLPSKANDIYKFLLKSRALTD
uniref:Uncharacterized protein n=1 Tax=Arundo donax TaxID=35708 RepID=A0A0A9SBK5_ARUDO